MGATDIFMGMAAENAINKHSEELQQKEQLATILLDDSRPARNNFDVKKEVEAIEKILPSQMPNQDSLEQSRRALANRLSQFTPGEFEQIVHQLQSLHPATPEMRHPHLSVSSSDHDLSFNLGKDSNRRILFDALTLPVLRWNSAITGESIKNSFCSGQSDPQLTSAAAFLKSLSSRQIKAIAEDGYLNCK